MPPPPIKYATDRTQTTHDYQRQQQQHRHDICGFVVSTLQSELTQDSIRALGVFTLCTLQISIFLLSYLLKTLSHRICYTVLRNRLPVGGGCVCVLQLFFLFFFVFFCVYQNYETTVLGNG